MDTENQQTDSSEEVSHPEHICGTPDALCDGLCVEYYYQELRKAEERKNQR